METSATIVPVVISKGLFYAILRHYQIIEDPKERYRKLSSEDIKDRLLFGALINEVQIAYREVLDDRGDM